MTDFNRMTSAAGRILITILLPLVLLLTMVQIFTFDKNFYLKEFVKYDVPAVTKMDLEDLEKVTVRLIDYLKGKEETLDMEAPIGGEMREVFGEREKQHMVDVKVLFRGGYLIRNYGAFIILCIMALLWFIIPDGKRQIYRGLLSGSILSICLMLILAVLTQIDFNKYFTHFHEIFFDNDLWLLDPNTEVLIQMLPLEFFIDITTAILAWFMGIMAVTGVLSYRQLKKI